MATTTYTIFANDEAKGTKSKKAQATALALELRDSEKVDVRVETQAGNIVFEAKAPKKINMSPKYTRVVALPDEVTVPDGFRVAYVRPRANVALLHNPELEVPYRLLNLKTNKLRKGEFATTRDAGRAMTALAAKA